MADFLLVPWICLSAFQIYVVGAWELSVLTKSFHDSALLSLMVCVAFSLNLLKLILDSRFRSLRYLQTGLLAALISRLQSSFHHGTLFLLVVVLEVLAMPVLPLY